MLTFNLCSCKKNTLSKKEKVENLGILVSGIIGIIVSLVVLGGFFFIAFTVIILIEYFVLLPRRSIEIEYSFFDHVLEISYIYNKEKRKTHTSSAVTSRYQKKVYEKYSLALRKIEDADIIEMIETEKAKGFGTTEAIKNLIKKN